jgi:EmrB/QacA subfamily drug resistance transporter
VNAVDLAEAGSAEEFGGKAAGLARALRSGLPAPGGFAISASLVERIATGDAAAEREATDWLSRYPVPVAVRSSAIGEDSASASFAGQHATILNVHEGAGLLEAIREIHASASGQAATEYRARLGIEGDVRTGAVVQSMIAAKCSGVLFTHDPMTGADERVIEASWGLGEAIVAGLVVPDRYRLRRDGQIIERKAGMKDLEILPTASGTEEVHVGMERATALCLDDAQLLALHQLALDCERIYGAEQDLEFAFSGGRLFLLQARPITVPRDSLKNPPTVAAHSDVRAVQPSNSDGRSESSATVAGARQIFERVAARQPEPAAAQAEPAAIDRRLFTGLLLAAVLAPLNSTIIAVALPTIAVELRSTAAEVTWWLVTSYLLVSIVLQSPAGKLGDLWGHRRILTAGRLLFAAGAIVAVFAPQLGVLAAGRLMMAAGGALAIPTVLAQIRNSVAPERRGRVFGIFGAAMGTAAAIGPLLGGVLVGTFGWQSIFLVNLPIVAASLILAPPRRRTAAPRPVERFDFPGTLIFTTAIVLFVIALGDPQQALLPLSGAVVLLLFFIWFERRVVNPLIDPRLFSIIPFTAGSTMVGLHNLTMYALLFLLPFLLRGAGADATAIGMLLLAMTAAMVIASPIGGRLADALGARSIACTGSLTATAGAFLLVSRPIEAATFTFVSLATLGVGLGLSSSPMQAAALGAVEPERAGLASGVLSTIRYVGGIIGSAIIALIATRGADGTPLLLIFPFAILVSAFLALLLPGRLARVPRTA